jgi:hypothetical protein
VLTYTQLAYGLDRGGIDERWLGSTTPAANENRTTPNAERRTPNAKRQTPNAKRQTPNAKRQTPNAKRQTPTKKAPLHAYSLGACVAAGTEAKPE